MTSRLAYSSGISSMFAKFSDVLPTVISLVLYLPFLTFSNSSIKLSLIDCLIPSSVNFCFLVSLKAFSQEFSTFVSKSLDRLDFRFSKILYPKLSSYLTSLSIRFLSAKWFSIYFANTSLSTSSANPLYNFEYLS